MTTTVTNPVARGLRWVAGVLGILAVGCVFAGLNFTSTGPDLVFVGTLAFVAFGIPAALTILLSLWLDHPRETDDELQDHELVTGATVSRSPFGESLAAYAMGVLFVLVAWGVRHVLDPYLVAYAPFPTFFLAVALAGWLGGFGPAILAIVVSTALARYFFMTPLHELTIDSVLTAVSICTFVVVSLFLAAVTSMLHAALRRIKQLTSTPVLEAPTTSGSGSTPIALEAE